MNITIDRRPTLWWLLLAAIWSVGATTAFSQDAANHLHVQLSLADDKTHYRIGEPIKIALSFTADREGYQLDITGDRPPSGEDDITVSPDTGVFHWLDQASARYWSDHDARGVTPLSATPQRVTLALNDWFRFDRPGQYTVRVTTRRVSRPDRIPGFAPSIPLTTDEVSFDLEPMSQADEEKEIQRLSAQFEAARDWQTEAKMAEELSFLTGDASTREKVRRFLDTKGRAANYDGNILLGLYMARNRPLVLQLLEAALRDPNREVTPYLLDTIVRFRLCLKESETPKLPSIHDSQLDPQTSAIQNGYIKEIAASLPKRTGKNRMTTAQTIFTSLRNSSVEMPEVLSNARQILLQGFDSLDPNDQQTLLGAYWKQLRDPSLVPSIKRILENNRGPRMYSVRTEALRRLMELAPEEARPFVAAEIRDPVSHIELEVLESLSEPMLPEVDAALLQQIRDHASLKQRGDDSFLKYRARLVARYASASIYQDLLETYQTWGGKWSPVARASLLGYFVRYNDNQAMPLIEQALASIAPDQHSSFFHELTRYSYSDGIDALLKKRLDSDDPQSVGFAASLMSAHGPPSDQMLIEARLERWLREWNNRRAELDAPEAGEKMARQRMVQIELIGALIYGKSWKLPEWKVKQLQQSCLTQECRERFKVP